MKKNPEVKYFGNTIQVPEWARYVATDKNGIVFAYEDAPIITENSEQLGEWVINPRLSFIEWEELGTVDLEGMDWKKTLMPVFQS